MWVRQARAGAAWRLSIPRWQNLSGSKTLEPPPGRRGEEAGMTKRPSLGGSPWLQGPRQRGQGGGGVSVWAA